MLKFIIPNFFKIPDSTKIFNSEIKNENSNKRYRNNLFKYYFILLN